jgi:hypothetical protein
MAEIRRVRAITLRNAPPVNEKTDHGRGRKRDKTAHQAIKVQAIREIQHTTHAPRCLETSAGQSLVRLAGTPVAEDDQ